MRLTDGSEGGAVVKDVYGGEQNEDAYTFWLRLVLRHRRDVFTRESGIPLLILLCKSEYAHFLFAPPSPFFLYQKLPRLKVYTHLYF